MKKFLLGSIFILLLMSMHLSSCKKETSISTTQPTTTQAVDLQDVYKRADAGGIMIYNHLRYNFLTVKPEEYFIMPNRDKFDSNIKAFNYQTAGLSSENKLGKLKEMKYISESELLYLSQFIKTVAENENDMESAMAFIDKQHLDIATNDNLNAEEKMHLTVLSALLKYPAKFLIENNLNKQKNANSANASFRCFWGSSSLCILTNITVGIVISVVSTAYATPIAGAVGISRTAAIIISAIAGGASSAAGLLINCGDCNQPTCSAPDVASLTIDGGCNTSGTVSITGGLDKGQGFGVNNSNASPSFVNLSSSTTTFRVNQVDNSYECESNIHPYCQPDNGGSPALYYRFNIYSMIHNPGNPSFIQGNNSPSSGSIETYYVLGDVNKPGSQIVANVQGSLGMVIGSIAGQQGYTLLVNWFRSGSGSLSVQTQSACGEMSGSITLPISVH